MRRKVNLYALMIALVFHTVIAFVAGLYLLVQTGQFKDLVGIEILQTDEPPKPRIGKFVPKPIIKPTVSTQNIDIGYVQTPTPCNNCVCSQIEFPIAESAQVFKPNH